MIFEESYTDSAGVSHTKVIDTTNLSRAARVSLNDLKNYKDMDSIECASCGLMADDEDDEYVIIPSGKFYCEDCLATDEVQNIVRSY